MSVLSDFGFFSGGRLTWLGSVVSSGSGLKIESVFMVDSSRSGTGVASVRSWSVLKQGKRVSQAAIKISWSKNINLFFFCERVHAL